MTDIFYDIEVEGSDGRPFVDVSSAVEHCRRHGTTKITAKIKRDAVALVVSEKAQKKLEEVKAAAEAAGVISGLEHAVKAKAGKETLYIWEMEKKVAGYDGGYSGLGIFGDVIRSSAGRVITLYDKEPLYEEEEAYGQAPAWLARIRSQKGQTQSTVADLWKPADDLDDLLEDHAKRLKSARYDRDGMEQTLTLIGLMMLARQKAPVMTAEELTEMIEEILTGGAAEMMTEEDGVDYFDRSGSGRPTFFHHDRFARDFIEAHHVCLVDQVLHTFDPTTGTYSPEEFAMERQIIQEQPETTQTHRNNAIASMRGLAPIKEHRSEDDEWIICRDESYTGWEMVNLFTGEVRPASPDKMIRNPIPWHYRPEGPAELTEGVEELDVCLDKLSDGDRSKRKVMEESCGLDLYRGPIDLITSRNIELLLGERNCGKTTYLKLKRALYGEKNCSFSSLDKIAHGPYSVAELYGKLVDLGDEISTDIYEGECEVLKILATGADIEARKIRGTPFFFRSYARLIFTAEDLPRFKEKTGGLNRRLLPINFSHDFAEDPDADSAILSNLTQRDSMEYLLYLAIRGFQRAYLQGGFSKCDDVDRMLDEYRDFNDPLHSYWQTLQKKEVIGSTPKDMYDRYLAWHKDHRYDLKLKDPYKDLSFWRALCSRYGVKAQNAGSGRCVYRPRKNNI